MRRRDDLSRKALTARVIFGLWPDDARKENARRVRDAVHAAARLDSMLKPGHVALVTGPSGSGKSSLLVQLVRRLRARRRTIVAAENSQEDDTTNRRSHVLRTMSEPRVVDLFDLPLDETLRVLAMAGLAEATIFTSRPRDLSHGQRHRLRLALAMALVHKETIAASRVRSVTLIVDELASTLDRTTACCVAATLRRWTSMTPGVRVVCATAHDDLAGSLRPDVLVHQALLGKAEFRLAAPRARHAKRREG